LRMARFCRAMTDHTGRLPAIGDDDGGALFPMCGRAPWDAGPTLSLAANLLTEPSLAVGPLREEVVWMMAGEDGGLAAPAGPTSSPESQLFPDTGYVALHSAHGHAIVDVGRHGFLNGGHAHADALSITLSLNGRPLLIDPGTATYVMDPALRDRLRTTAMHNTLVIDGRSQSIPAGPFQWRTRTDARLVDWKSSPSFDYVAAEHDGYLPIVHRRLVVRVDEVWIVADILRGEGKALAEAHWHVDPAWLVRRAPMPSAYFAESTEERVLIASTAPESNQLFGDSDGLGWSAPVYGDLVPSPTIRFVRSAALPFSLITAVAGPAAEATAELRAVSDDTSDSCTVRLTYGGHSYLASFGCQGQDRDPKARLGRKVAFEGNSFYTDACVAVLRLAPGNVPMALHLIGGSTFEWIGAGSFNLHNVAMELHLDEIALRQLQHSVQRR
jgi:Heparinase II/III-like protein